MKPIHASLPLPVSSKCLCCTPTIKRYYVLLSMRIQSDFRVWKLMLHTSVSMAVQVLFLRWICLQNRSMFLWWPRRSRKLVLTQQASVQSLMICINWPFWNYLLWLWTKKSQSSWIYRLAFGLNIGSHKHQEDRIVALNSWQGPLWQKGSGYTQNQSVILENNILINQRLDGYNIPHRSSYGKQEVKMTFRPNHRDHPSISTSKVNPRLKSIVCSTGANLRLPPAPTPLLPRYCWRPHFSPTRVPRPFADYSAYHSTAASNYRWPNKLGSWVHHHLQHARPI